MSPVAVRIAKSRVLARLRAEAEELIDWPAHRLPRPLRGLAPAGPLGRAGIRETPPTIPSSDGRRTPARAGTS